MINSREKIAWLVIRIGIAFCFLYAAIAGFVDPQSWVGWFPKFMRELLPDNTLLGGWGIFEIILALWILSGKKIFIPSVLASLSLAGLILYNLNVMDIIFRDVTILCATIALAIESWPSKWISKA